MINTILTFLWNNVPFALLLTRLLVVPVSFALHELAHALTAALLGDPTPRAEGRLTINPLPHLEPIGMIGGLLIGVGWSRPVPTQPHKMRVPDRLGELFAVLSGPLASGALVLLGQALFAWSALAPTSPWTGLPVLSDVVTVLVRFNLTLALLNLLPLFPLDGWYMVRALLPLQASGWWQRDSGWTTTVLGVGFAALLILPPGLLRRMLAPLLRWALIDLLGW